MAKSKQKSTKPKREPVNAMALHWYCRAIRKELSSAACGISVAEFSISSGNMGQEGKKLAAAGMEMAAESLDSLSRKEEGRARSLIRKAKGHASAAHSILKQEGALSADQALSLRKEIYEAKASAERASKLADNQCQKQISRIRE